MYKTLVAASLAAGALAGEHVTALDASNWNSLVYDGHHNVPSDKGWFVKFYAPWCGHCKKLAPIWENFAAEHSDKANIAEMDCTTNDNKSICQEMGVKGYPTLLWFPPGSDTNMKYLKGRDIDSFVAYVSGGWQQ